MYSRGGGESYHSKLHDETTHELLRASLLAQLGSAAACIMPLVFASGDSGSSTSSGNYKGCVTGTPNMKRKRLDMDSYLGKMNDRAFECRERWH